MELQLPQSHCSSHETQSQPSADVVGRFQEDIILREASQNLKMSRLRAEWFFGLSLAGIVMKNFS